TTDSPEPLPPPKRVEDGDPVPPRGTVMQDPGGGEFMSGDRPARESDPLWFSGEYLLWWTKGSNLPPLVTTGSPAAARPGALGQPGTSVLFGGDVDSGPRSGARFAGGLW